MADPHNKAARLKNVHPREKKERAEELFNTYFTLDEIGAEIDVPAETVRTWAKTGDWYKKRRLICDEAAAEVAEKKKGQLRKISTLLLDGLEKAIEKEVKKGLDPKQLARYASMATDFDKLMRLAHGQATDIKEERHLHAHGHLKLTEKSTIAKIINSDPMMRLNYEEQADEAIVVESEEQDD